MNTLFYFKLLVLSLVSIFSILPLHAESSLSIIDQDYKSAVQQAIDEDKLLFIDFYTSWCGPCKKLDKLIFQNDSIQSILGKHFVLLKYNAEIDSVFHLSKKHHIRSYPTAIVLNQKERIVNRKYGFKGDTFDALLESVLNFTNESIELATQQHYLSGYSADIDPTPYPEFYKEYIERTNTKPDPNIMKAYWNQPIDKYSEHFFSTLFYFADEEIPLEVRSFLLDNKKKYETLYGETDVSILLYFMSMGELDRALESKKEADWQLAKRFTIEALGKEEAMPIIDYYQTKYQETTSDN